MNPGPRLVVHLLINHPGEAVGHRLVKRMDQFFTTDDPKHIEAPERIERHETPRGGAGFR